MCAFFSFSGKTSYLHIHIRRKYSTFDVYEKRPDISAKEFSGIFADKQKIKNDKKKRERIFLSFLFPHSNRSWNIIIALRRRNIERYTSDPHSIRFWISFLMHAQAHTLVYTAAVVCPVHLYWRSVRHVNRVLCVSFLFDRARLFHSTLSMCVIVNLFLKQKFKT